MKTIKNNIPHIYEQYVDYQDTDAAGVVHHSSYINFAERARSKLFRDLFSGLEFSQYLWVVTHLEAKFIAPARLGNYITLRTYIKEITGCSIILKQDILVNYKLIVSMIVKIVSLNQDFKVVKFTNPIKCTLVNYYKENTSNE